MSQHDMSIANQDFPTTRTDLNLALVALASTSIGTSAPATLFTGQLWVDSTAAVHVLNFYDGTDHIPLLDIDTTNNRVATRTAGIDDNATGERFQLGNTEAVWGTASTQFSHLHVATDSALVFSGGSATNLGANVFMYGELHATLPDRWLVQQSAVARIEIAHTDGDADILLRDAVGATKFTLEGDTGNIIVADDLKVSGVFSGSATNSITSGTTQTQAGATALAANYNRVTTHGNVDDGVKLPSAVAGTTVKIHNDTATADLQVWPNTSDGIEGGSANAVGVTKIGAGVVHVYEAASAVVWYLVDSYTTP